MVSEPSPRPQPPAGHWHTRSRQEVARLLGITWDGLSSKEAQRRLHDWGPNALPKAAKPSLWFRFAHQFKSPLIAILFAAAGIAFLAGKQFDPYVILAIVLINATIGFLQEERAERAIEALQSLTAPQARVWRDGHIQEIASDQVVRGDVLDLASGDLVAADARLLFQNDLEIDESMLTGESVPKAKTVDTLTDPHLPLAEWDNLVLMGTAVTRGRGRALVFATGRDTAMGRIASSLGQTPGLPPIQRRLARFSRNLALAAFIVISVFSLIGLLRNLPLNDLLVFALSMVVSFIPEGLPIAVTVLLAVGVWRMARRRALVRNLPAVESLGHVTTICSDKTGTLTQNQMTVREVLTLNHHYQVSGMGYQPEGRLHPTPHGDRALHWLLTAAHLCNDSEVEERDQQWRVLGDPMEGALKTLAAKGPWQPDWPRVDELPFNAERRWMATLHEQPGGLRAVLVKGAPEIVLSRCNQWLDATSRPHPMAPDIRARIEAQVQAVADEARRTLAFAYLPEPDPATPLEDHPLIWLGLAGLEDPPRPEAITAIAQCQEGGIRVVMITGDHQATAAAIARQMGILRSHERVVDGRTLNRWDDEELDRHMPDIAVFARVEPQHKTRIVQSLQRQGEIVAMTGDGVNDAPALRRADVGVSMGLSGTEVAKAASDMVLVDDHFATIVAAVEEGRVMARNLRRVLLYLLSTSSGEVLLILVTLLVGLPLPLIAVQILWINLVTDGALDKGLALEPGHQDVLNLPPPPPSSPLIHREGLVRIVSIAAVMMLGSFAVYYHQLAEGDTIEKARTMTFNTLVAFQWASAVTLRSLHRPVWQLPRNPVLLMGLAIAVPLQLIALYSPWLETLFQTEPLSAAEFLESTAVGLLLLVGHEGYKWWAQTRARKRSAA